MVVTITVDKVLSTAIELPSQPQETHFSYSAQYGRMMLSFIESYTAISVDTSREGSPYLQFCCLKFHLSGANHKETLKFQE